MDQRGPRHEGVGAQCPIQRGLIVTEFKFCLGGEQIPVSHGRIIGDRRANGLLDLLQPLLRLAEFW